MTGDGRTILRGPLVGGTNAGKMIAHDRPNWREAIIPRSVADFVQGAGEHESLVSMDQNWSVEEYSWEDLRSRDFQPHERPGFWRLISMSGRDAILELFRGYRRP